MKHAILLIIAIAGSSAAAAPARTRPAAAATPTVSDADKAAVLAVLAAWLKAQNDGDFDAYVAQYDAKFAGIKRTSWSEKRFSLATWKADRKKMFKAAQKVAAERTKIIPRGDTITVVFVQRYSSGGYADHGDKVLGLRATQGAWKITREEMRYSAPGWDDDPNAEIDATGLSSPIRVAVRQQAYGPPDHSIPGATYTLELTDARGRKLSREIGSASGEADAPIAMLTGDQLSRFGMYLAGGGDYYKVVRNGDALMVHYLEEEEGSVEYPATPGEWELHLTVRLPAKAVVK